MAETIAAEMMAETIATSVAGDSICEACVATAAGPPGLTDGPLVAAAGFFSQLLDTKGFPPRWECGDGWTAGHGWLHIVSDFAIFGAYFAIPVVLAYFLVRRRDIPFPPIMWLFVGFIALCGVGHLVEGTIFWIPWYRLSGVLKATTAVVSWVTVIALFRVVPLALQFPGLAKLNTELHREMAERQKVEASLRDRAKELEAMNRELAAASRMTIGREDRLLELKDEVNDLLAKLGEAPRYRTQFDAPS